MTTPRLRHAHNTTARPCSGVERRHATPTGDSNGNWVRMIMARLAGTFLLSFILFLPASARPDGAAVSDRPGTEVRAPEFFDPQAFQDVSDGGEAESSPHVGEEDELDRLVRQTEAADRLLDDLEQGEAARDPRAAQAVMDQLAAMGPSVLPLIDRRLQRRGDLPLVQARERLKLMMSAGPGATPTGLQLSAEPQPPEGPDELMARDQESLHDLLRVRFREAFDSYKSGNLEHARDLCAALMVVAPRAPWRNEARLLKVRIEEAIVREGMVEPTLTSPKTILEAGEPIPLTFGLTNKTSREVEIVLQQSPGSGGPKDDNGKTSDMPRPARPCVYVKVSLTEFDPYGASITRQIDEVFDVNTPSIRLEPGQTWTLPATLDSSLAGEGEEFHPAYREVMISAEIRPYAVTQGQRTLRRKLAAPPLTVRLFPLKLDPVLADPMAHFRKALGTGGAEDLFLAGLLVPAGGREEATGMLMDALRQCTTEPAKLVIMNTLHRVTGRPFEIDSARWMEWWMGRKQKDR